MSKENMVSDSKIDVRYSKLGAVEETEWIELFGEPVGGRFTASNVVAFCYTCGYDITLRCECEGVGSWNLVPSYGVNDSKPAFDLSSRFPSNYIMVGLTNDLARYQTPPPPKPGEGTGSEMFNACGPFEYPDVLYEIV